MSFGCNTEIDYAQLFNEAQERNQDYRKTVASLESEISHLRGALTSVLSTGNIRDAKEVLAMANKIRDEREHT